MVEQFHQFDKCEFWIFAVHIVHLSAKGLAEWPSCDHLRPIGNKSLIEWMRLQNKMRRYIKWAICVPTVLEIRQIELIYIPSVPKSLKSCTDGHSDKKKRHPWKDVSVNIWQWDSSATLGMTLTRLLVERSSNVNRTSNSTTNHRVVTDAEESHHLNVCWNWWRTCELCVRVHTTHSVGQIVVLCWQGT